MSHSWTKDDVEDGDLFLEKYKKDINHLFMMGYFIHLHTDLLRNQYFVSDTIENDTITLLDRTKIKRDRSLYKTLIYNDYTNLNVQLLGEY